MLGLKNAEEKEDYVAAKCKVSEIECADVILTSATEGGNDGSGGSGNKDDNGWTDIWA